ncbi:uncharacterized protein LOC131145645 isoform X3 [Malania oleifera]|uniref:uncharacterized protein LOC131145645 isoform X3 n=1 Tax=Malania oleifera TaxID=397392 RepID=UPI0025ADC0FB|nr:uncharacterized protein LOC131145645 isoform X3 [Malania oleifera]
MPSARKIQPKRARERVSCPPRPRRLSPLPRVNSCFTRSKQGMVQSCLHQTHLFFQNPSTKFGIFTPTCTHFCCVLHANTVEFLSISEVRIIFCLCFRLYSCYNCRNHVSLHDDIISKAFQIFAQHFFPIILFLGKEWTSLSFFARNEHCRGA